SVGVWVSVPQIIELRPPDSLLALVDERRLQHLDVLNQRAVQRDAALHWSTSLDINKHKGRANPLAGLGNYYALERLWICGHVRADLCGTARTHAECQRCASIQAYSNASAQL